MKNIKFLSLLVTVALILSLLAGCADNDKGSDGNINTPSGVDAGSGYEEGTSDTDNIVNTTTADKVILVVSFGTSYNQSRSLTIGGIEDRKSVV